MIPTVLCLLYGFFLSLKNDVNVPSKSNKQKNLNKVIFVAFLKVIDKNSRVPDPDPDPLVTGTDRGSGFGPPQELEL